MHIKGHSRESRVGRTAEERLRLASEMLTMAMELRISAIQRECGCTRHEAEKRYRAEWDRASRKKVEQWRASLGDGR